MSEREQRHRRKLWREQQKRSRLKRKTTLPKAEPHPPEARPATSTTYQQTLCQCPKRNLGKPDSRID